jgi:hypothetical protein
MDDTRYFLLLGIGVLVPWNTFISAKPYFESRLCSYSISPKNDTIQQQQQQPLRYVYAGGGLPNIESTFSTVYNVSSVLTMVLIIGVQMLRDSIRTAAPVVQQPGRSSRRTIVTPAGSTTSTTLVELSASQQDVTALGTYVNHHDPLDSMQSGSNVGANCIIHDDEIDHEFNRTRSSSLSALPSSSPSTSSTQDHSFWLVIVPFLLFILAFGIQLIMVLILHVPYVWYWTVLCLSICGVASGISGAGLVATAGAIPLLV